MSWIAITEPEDSEPPLREVYGRHGVRPGRLARIVGVSSVNPPVLDAHMQLYRAIMFRPSPLSRAEREMLAVLVSRANDCFY